MKTVFMFPGQGSQSIGMMSDLLQESSIARQIFEEASDTIKVDLSEIALNGPIETINQTAITQPIVLTASIAMWKVWQSVSDIRPDYVCGHSLGEYTALIASGVLSLSDVVSLVHLRGRLMQSAVPEGEGGMAAILGLDDDVVQQVCIEAAQGDVVAAANFNSPGQIVISGATKALERAMLIAKEKGAKRVAKLAVSVPCHCELLKPAGEALAAKMETLVLAEPSIPIIQNVTSEEALNLADLSINLLAHLYRPVLWSQSISNLVKKDAKLFVECGPGKVLSGLNKRIDKSVKAMPMNNTESMEGVLSTLTQADFS